MKREHRTAIIALVVLLFIAFSVHVIKKSILGDPRNFEAGPIAFYGKVIDQIGNPVPGVLVKLRYGKLVGYRDVEHTVTRTSDANGNFNLLGVEGDGVAVEMQLDGYRLSTRKTTFKYSPLDMNPAELPTADKPAIFKMWWTGPAVSLVRRSEVGAIITPDKLWWFNPATGEYGTDVEGGIGFEVKWLKFDPAQNHPLDWQITVRASEGGVLEGDQDRWYTAPDDGYSPMLKFIITEDRAGVQPERAVYYRWGNPERYGVCRFNVSNEVRRGTASIFLMCFENPSGSRNLNYEGWVNKDWSFHPKEREKREKTRGL
jgi:hypothetical protein